MSRKRSMLGRFLTWLTSNQKPSANEDLNSSEENRRESIHAQQLVEFVGGPLDGYQEYIDAGDHEQCLPFVSVPISRATFWRLDGRHSQASCTPAACQPTSVASYELRTAEKHWQYQFCCQVHPATGSTATGSTKNPQDTGKKSKAP